MLCAIMPTRVVLGTASLRSCSLLPAKSRAMSVNPVTLPPGRARLATNPCRTGSSLTFPITMGIVLVASLAACVGERPTVTMQSTWRPTSSAASCGCWSSLPLANRHSIIRFFPQHNQTDAVLLGKRSHWAQARLYVTGNLAGKPCPVAAPRRDERSAMRTAQYVSAKTLDLFSAGFT